MNDALPATVDRLMEAGYLIEGTLEQLDHGIKRATLNTKSSPENYSVLELKHGGIAILVTNGEPIECQTMGDMRAVIEQWKASSDKP